ncbi:MAG: nucleotide pyrophosphohydrolase [Planctomycetota bacterium]
MTEHSPAADDAPGASIRDFQRRIEQIYYERDAERGLAGTYMWFVEEVGELARSFISGTPASDDEAAEFADCLAWLSTLASIRGVDLGAAAWKKYGAGCPRCEQTPCNCQHREGGASE